jgi:hypothetical protein
VGVADVLEETIILVEMLEQVDLEVAVLVEKDLLLDPPLRHHLTQFYMEKMQL